MSSFSNQVFKTTKVNLAISFCQPKYSENTKENPNNKIELTNHVKGQILLRSVFCIDEYSSIFRISRVAFDSVIVFFKVSFKKFFTFCQSVHIFCKITYKMDVIFIQYTFKSKTFLCNISKEFVAKIGFEIEITLFDCTYCLLATSILATAIEIATQYLMYSLINMRQLQILFN